MHSITYKSRHLFYLTAQTCWLSHPLSISPCDHVIFVPTASDCSLQKRKRPGEQKTTGKSLTWSLHSLSSRWDVWLQTANANYIAVFTHGSNYCQGIKGSKYRGESLKPLQAFSFTDSNLTPHLQKEWMKWNEKKIEASQT